MVPAESGGYRTRAVSEGVGGPRALGSARALGRAAAVFLTGVVSLLGLGACKEQPTPAADADPEPDGEVVPPPLEELMVLGGMELGRVMAEENASAQAGGGGEGEDER